MNTRNLWPASLRAGKKTIEARPTGQPGYLLDNAVHYEPNSAKLTTMDGKVVELNANSNILLQALLNGVTRKDAIIEAVWSQRGMVVAENSYHQLVKLLRDRFAEAGLPAGCIKTLPRHGIQFQGQFTHQAQQQPVVSAPTLPWRRALALLLLGYGLVWLMPHKQSTVFRPFARLAQGKLYVHQGMNQGDPTRLGRQLPAHDADAPYLYYIKRGNTEWITSCPGPVEHGTDACSSRLYVSP